MSGITAAERSFQNAVYDRGYKVVWGAIKAAIDNGSTDSDTITAGLILALSDRVGAELFAAERAARIAAFERAVEIAKEPAPIDPDAGIAAWQVCEAARIVAALEAELEKLNERS